MFMFQQMWFYILRDGILEENRQGAHWETNIYNMVVNDDN